MNPAISATLNQQLMSGTACGQQGMFAESQGNALGAAQLYDQAIGWIQQSMMTAQQWGTFVPDGVHATLANAHACAARVKNMLGYSPMAWQHLHQSLQCLNQAIAQNPYLPVYHAAAGTILMSMGNLRDAHRAFSTVQQLQPGEPMSQQMLGMLQGMQGMQNNMQPVPSWGGMQPAMPTPVMGGTQPFMQGMSAPPPAAGGSSQADWMKTVSNACSMLDSVFKTAGGFQDMMGKFD